MKRRFLYAFTVDDPTTYTQVWGGVIPYKRFNDKVFEYACHEGNYGLASRTERGALSGENGSGGIERG